MISNIYLGKTNLSISQAIIQKLKQNYSKDKFAKHIFLVPDRVSVLTEIKIFESLNIDSTISIEVLTLSRLASKIINTSNVISKDASVMIIEKILKQNKNNLQCFNKTISIDLANNIFEIISQFKSCKIDVEKVLVKNNNKILQDKLGDLSFVYKQYQNYLAKNNLLDSTDKINVLLKNINNSYIKNSYFYVCNFDGFTFQGFELLSQICKNCCEFNIGVLDSANPINEHIYNKNFLQKIKKTLSVWGNPNIVYCEDVEGEDFAYLRDNLFGFNLKPKFIKKDSINLFESETFEQEVLFCASNIKDLIINKNYSFNDFVVVVPALQENFTTVQKIFDDYCFNYYLDITEPFENSVIVKYIKSLFGLLEENYSKASVLSFVKNPFFNFSKDIVEDFEDVLNKYNLKNFGSLVGFKLNKIESYENFNCVRERLLTITKPFKNFVLNKTSTFNGFVKILQEFLNSCNALDLINNEIVNLVNKNEIKQAKLYEQYYKKLTEVLDEICLTLGEEECNFELFTATFLAGVRNVKLSLSPISTNAIFVGDASLSFFDKSKVYFVLKCQEDVFPKVLEDNGLISDKEIEELSESYLLEPSIKEINFKERFKAFDVLLKAQDKLFLSYNYSSHKNPKGKIFDDVSKLFQVEIDGGFKQLPILSVSNLNLNLFNSYKVAYNQFVKMFGAYINGQEEDKNKITVLFNALKLKEKDLQNFYFKNDIKINNNLFFLKKSVSVSQIESFMTCPFLHFCNYGLNLKQKETGEVNPINIGLILHEVAEEFLKNYAETDDKSIEEIAKNIFDNIIKKENYENLLYNEENKIIIKNLRTEAIRLCKFLDYQLKNSKFKPIYFEASFSQNNKIKSIKFNVDGNEIWLKGKIDRVDVYDKFFRIIDYKTGNCDRSLKELYFGKKVQLDAYLSIIEKSLKLTPVGAYYFPIKGGFDEEESSNKKYKLKGETLNTLDAIDASDIKFLDGNLESDLIEVRFLSNSLNERKISGRAKVCSLEEINLRGEYSLKLIEKACEDILKLNVTPNPLNISGKDACKNCNYFSFCKFSEKFNNKKRKPEVKLSIDNLNFLKEEKNEQV